MGCGAIRPYGLWGHKAIWGRQEQHPRLRYALRCPDAQLFQLLPNGMVVADSERLQPADTHSMQVGEGGTGGLWGGWGALWGH